MASLPRSSRGAGIVVPGRGQNYWSFAQNNSERIGTAESRKEPQAQWGTRLRTTGNAHTFRKETRECLRMLQDSVTTHRYTSLLKLPCLATADACAGASEDGSSRKAKSSGSERHGATSTSTTQLRLVVCFDMLAQPVLYKRRIANLSAAATTSPYQADQTTSSQKQA